jgi:colanic acid biosynthesis glycosyl transferase WcaI
MAQAVAGMERVRLLPLQPVERLNDWLNLAEVHLLPQKGSAADLVLPSKLLGILASGRPEVASSSAGSALGELAEVAGGAGGNPRRGAHHHKSLPEMQTEIGPPQMVQQS